MADERDYNDIMEMDQDKIIESINEDAKGFFANVARQIRSELGQQETASKDTSTPNPSKVQRRMISKIAEKIRERRGGR